MYNVKFCAFLFDSYTCICDQKFWLGKNCDQPNPCLSNPCGAEKTCVVDSPPDTFHCKYNVYKDNFKVRKPFVYTSQTEFDDSYFVNDVLNGANFCKINICVNGATCVLDRKKKGMKCSCLPGYTGIFCENKILNQVTLNQAILNLNQMPAICKNEKNLKNITKNSVLLTASLGHYSFYLIQDGFVWHFDTNSPADLNIWPVEINKLFPSSQNFDTISAIIYDSIKKEFLIFKVNKSFPK